jgi:two-component system OmpR family sensor kinase
MTSIRRHLLAYLLGGLVVSLAFVGAFVYREALIQADAIFDFQMERLAHALPTHALIEPIDPLADQPSDELVVQVWTQDGEHLYLSHRAVRLPRNPQLGFATVAVDGVPWRILSEAVRGQLVQIAQPVQVRERVAAGTALRTVLPLALILPLLALGVYVEVRRGLQPLARLSAEVSRRSPTALEPIAQRRPPEELQPLVHSLNALLERLKRALELQRAFIADAAHELRSPLTAVLLQAQLAERARGGDERRQAFQRLREGLARSKHAIEQLLALARAEPESPVMKREPLDLADLVRSVGAGYAAIADTRGVALSVAGETSMPARGDPDALRVLFGNLIDNAIRYTPAGGSVEAAVRGGADDQAVVEIRDTGPGVPPADRARVFDRFYRGANTGAGGSGLGLAIVKAIADRHRAVVTLNDGPEGRGLLVRVELPAGGWIRRALH